MTYNFLRDARIAKGLSQTQLSKLSGIKQGSISQYEHGICKPDIKTFWKLANVLGIDDKYEDIFPNLKRQVLELEIENKKLRAKIDGLQRANFFKNILGIRYLIDNKNVKQMLDDTRLVNKPMKNYSQIVIELEDNDRTEPIAVITNDSFEVSKHFKVIRKVVFND